MPRIRTIKPSFFRSEDVSVLPFRARLTWIGLWTHCDDEGRTKDNARLIKGDIWPLDDVSLADIEEDLTTLAAHERIVRYRVGGRRYLEIVNWHDHQSIQKPTPSKIPPASEGTPLPISPSGRRATGAIPEKPPGRPQSAANEAAVGLPESSGSHTAGKGREGKGREGSARAREPDAPDRRPLDRCVEHEHDPDPPRCGACARARQAAERWDAEAASRAQALRSEEQRVRAADRERDIANCALCDERGYIGTRICHHDPDAEARAARGMELVRAALTKRPNTTEPDDSQE